MLTDSARTALAASGLRTSVRRDGSEYVGVLRRGSDIVAECGHRHANREMSTRSRGESAIDCIRRIVNVFDRPAVADMEAQRIANAWQGLRSGFYSVPTSAIDRARVEAPARVAEYRALVATVTDLIHSSQPAA
jgi:hypothetical protein